MTNKLFYNYQKFLLIIGLVFCVGFLSPGLVVAEDGVVSPESQPVVSETEIQIVSETQTSPVVETEAPVVSEAANVVSDIAPFLPASVGELEKVQSPEEITPEVIAPVSSPWISTEKADYSPGEKVTILGKFFQKLQDIVLRIFGNSEVGNHFSDVSLNVTTDENGSFSTSYLLDNFYRPIYSMTASTVDKILLATGVFTDASTASIYEYSQCANGTGSGPCNWSNGDLNSHNSNYQEGDATVQRLGLDGLANGVHTVTIEYQTTKGGKHAYDFLTDDNFSETYIDPSFVCDSPVTSNFPSCSTVSPVSSSLINTDINANGKDLLVGSRHFKIRNGEFISVGTPTIVSGDYTGDSLTDIPITFSVDTTKCADKVTKSGTDTCPVLITWGAHVASQADWGPGSSASNIPGSPYHVKVVEIDGKSAGNRDNQMQIKAITPNPTPATLTLVKIVTNDNGGNKTVNDFSLTATGIDTITGVSGTSSVTGASVAAGTYTLSEVNQPGYFAGSWSCDGATVTNGNQITLAEGQVTSCTITNDDQQSYVTVVKKVNLNNAGTAFPNDFKLTLNGEAVNSGVKVAVNPGTFTAAETQLSGYDFNGFSGDCDSEGKITVSLGESKTCTLTNDDQPGTLIVKKVVVNDNGGNLKPEDFSFKVNNGNSVSFEPDGQNDLIVDAGKYTVIETEVRGYSVTYDGCTDISIPNGGTATCTITNDDIAPKLTLVKTVINDNGGTLTQANFPSFVDGQPQAWDVVTEVIANKQLTASETSHSGYAASVWGGDCAADGTINLLPGDDKTCSITNDDIQPKLTLVKTVINDNGGEAAVSDFPLSVGETPVTSGESNGFNAGEYKVSETNKTGYAASVWGGDCAADGTVKLEIGDVKTCTITNNDIAPKLTLVKKVVNNYGGEATPESFTLTATGVKNNNVITGTTPVVSDDKLKSDTFTLSENELAGYKSEGWSCVKGNFSGAVLGDSIILDIGEEATCTITNNDLPGHLIVHKVTDPSTDITTPFSITASGEQVVSTANQSITGGSTVDYTVGRGTYAVSEDVKAGWDMTGNTCSDISVSNDETKECTITNVKKGHLVVQKTTLPAGDTTSFAITASGSGLITGGGTGFVTDVNDKDYEVVPGNYSVTENVPAGWDQTDNTCNNIVVAPGETKNCVITNTKRGIITVIKKTDPANDPTVFSFVTSGGDYKPFTLTGHGGTNTNVQILKPGQYSVTEDQSSWRFMNLACVADNMGSAYSIVSKTANITLVPGGSVTCTYLNANPRMTGGGSVFTDANTISSSKLVKGSRVTHGFELYCNTDAPRPNNLQINWGSKPENNFHLKELTSAKCSDNPNIDSGHPRAPFNTYDGTGKGTLNNKSGYNAKWTLTDAGEPGKNDKFSLAIYKDGDSINPIIKFDGLKLDMGNQQAH